MRSDSADQKKDRHGMVNMYYVVPAKIMLYISMETGPATLSPVAEVEPCGAGALNFCVLVAATTGTGVPDHPPSASTECFSTRES